MVRALVLAAGEGTRLRPYTLDRPKPMLPLGEQPLLAQLIGLLRHHGIRDIAINLHYRPAAIVEYFGDGSTFGVSLTYSYEERLLGSAGAARRLDWFLTDTFFVLYGDVLTDLDLSRLLAEHRARRALATLAVYEVPDPARCGIVDTRPDGSVRGFVEKPAADQAPGNLANAGLYVLEPAVLDQIPPDRPCDFGQDLFPRLIEAGAPIVACSAPGYVLDIGSPERYAQAREDLRLGRCRPFLARGAPCHEDAVQVRPLESGVRGGPAADRLVHAAVGPGPLAPPGRNDRRDTR
jgi:NDP-sugar pyrophosphorylase family protein